MLDKSFYLYYMICNYHYIHFPLENQAKESNNHWSGVRFVSQYHRLYMPSLLIRGNAATNAAIQWRGALGTSANSASIGSPECYAFETPEQFIAILIIL
jgi:hypothetical protein